MVRKEEPSHQLQLMAAKKSFKAAADEGDRAEEARWANIIGNLLKNRGEYVKAIQWMRKDYDLSKRLLSDKQMLAACQSLGEVHLRLHQYEEALKYQKKHLELAKSQKNLIEQQRASTQLGRTYHEMFLRSEYDHDSLREAKKYFRLSMEYARSIKQKPPSEKVSFVKEYIDAHNNLGMLEKDLDNFDEAERILREGLEICQEEEVPECDDTRSRLHHNLGNVYMELRKWKKALDHIRKDIQICKKIGHCQGEAKGYINHGVLHDRNQEYDVALASFQKALSLAKTLEDEVDLIEDIKQNISNVKNAMQVMNELKTEESNLKKLERDTDKARTEDKRKFLLKQNSSLDCLEDKSRMILAWQKLAKYGKQKKRIAKELCDKEKQGDSFLVVGESYNKLRKFDKALKWYNKSLKTYHLIGNLEGQAMTNINIGNVLDSTGDYKGALAAFEEGYRIAVNGKLYSLQVSALEHMHYSHMIRFDDADAARKTKLLIDKLKESEAGETQPGGFPGDCCSETKTESINLSTDVRPDGRFSPKKRMRNALEVKSYNTSDESDDNAPLISPLQSKEGTKKRRHICGTAPIASSFPSASPERSISRSSGILTVNRKRGRVIISDDEGENDENIHSNRIATRCLVEGSATSDESRKNHAPSLDAQDVSPVASRCTVDASTCPNLQNSTSSHKSRSSIFNHTNNSRIAGSYTAVGDSNTHGNINNNSTGSFNLLQKEMSAQHMMFKIDQELVYMDTSMYTVDSKLTIEQMKVDVACSYYLQLPREKRSRGLVPVIQHLKCGGKVLESMEALSSFKDLALEKTSIEVSVGVMVSRNVMKLYIDCCEELSEPPNVEVVRRLYNLEVSEDEILVSDCQLRDASVAPLLNALQMHKTLAVLDLSHNLLGNDTVEILRRVFMSSGQSYGGLVLNLHSNRLGPAALFQICECPVLYARLEVLDISGNSLTDACASYLSTILRNCKALYCLNIENCSVTSRTILKVADSLDSESALTHLFIGRNYPVSGKAVINLLLKLTATDRFQELSLNGIKISKPVVDSLCELARNSCLSGLLLGNTCIGTEGALQLIKPLSKDTQELVRLDLSNCALTCDYIVTLKDEASLFSGIHELNLGGNPIKKEGSSKLSSLLRSPHCLRILVVNKCDLGLEGVICILQALSENRTLTELNLADNITPDEAQALTGSPRSSQAGNFSPAAKNEPHSSKEASSEQVDAPEQEMHASEDQVEVPDSEDEKPESRDTSSPNKIVDAERKPEPMQELSSSIERARSLKLLDLSGNGFSEEVGVKMLTAWRSGDRADTGQRHVDGNTLHYWLKGNKCCGSKSCCRNI